MPGPIPTCKEPRALRKEAVPCSTNWDGDGVKKPRDQGSGGLEDAREPPGGQTLPVVAPTPRRPGSGAGPFPCLPPASGTLVGAQRKKAKGKCGVSVG